MAFSYEPLWLILSEKEMTIDDLINSCNISPSTISRMKNNQNINLSTLDKLCNHLDCDIDSLITRSNEKSNTYNTVEEPTVPISTSLDTISLFSGCGGLDLGLMKAGFNIVYANDNDKAAVENYRYNVGEIVQGDISEIDVTSIPEGDVVVGGFPCQPFSSAGNRRGSDDDRGNLFLDIIRVINNKNPKIVVMENVRGLLSMKNKDGSKLMDTILDLLMNAGQGYNVSYQLLKASDYGVPQNRFRVFIVGIRKDLDFTYAFPQPYDVKIDKLTVGNIINVPDFVHNSSDIWNLSPQSRELVKYIPEGGSWKDVPYEFLPERLKKIRDNMRKYRSPNFYRRFARNEINGTITAAATPENSGILHPIENRRYSVREIARFQSFPDEYVFVGSSIASKYKVIGNAVPPKLSKVIGDTLIEQLSFFEK